MPKNAVKTIPGHSNHIAPLCRAAGLYWTSPPELPLKWWQINLNHNDYHFDPMEISCTLWIPDITKWWRQWEETQPNYVDRSDVVWDIISIRPHGIGAEARHSLGQDVIGWRQSRTKGKTLCKIVIVRQLPWVNTWLLAGNDSALDWTNTDNNLEMKWEVEQKKLHRMAKVHGFLEMWQGNQNLSPTQKEHHAENMQMTTVGFIPDTDKTFKGYWSNFQQDSAAAFKLSERLHVLPALSAKNFPGGKTQICNVRRIKTINCHPAERDEDSTPESISDTENWLDWNGSLDYPTVSENNWKAYNECDIDSVGNRSIFRLLLI